MAVVVHVLFAGLVVIAVAAVGFAIAKILGVLLRLSVTITKLTSSN